MPFPRHMRTASPALDPVSAGYVTPFALNHNCRLDLCLGRLGALGVVDHFDQFSGAANTALKRWRWLDSRVRLGAILGSDEIGYTPLSSHPAITSPTIAP